MTAEQKQAESDKRLAEALELLAEKDDLIA